MELYCCVYVHDILLLIESSVVVIVLCCVVCVFFVFFQAEDGIRDLVRSRGLGDVYKRQGGDRGAPTRPQSVSTPRLPPDLSLRGCGVSTREPGRCLPLVDPVVPVSYTHLTLPTSDLV